MSTQIPYLDEAWNVTRGCTKTSEGCANCYASALSRRFSSFAFDGTVALMPERLYKPLHWRKPRRIGVCFMSDLFHEAVPDEFLDKVFAVMALTPRHTYLLLTKRPERMRAYALDSIRRQRDAIGFEEHAAIARPNVWLGVSVENQARADERIPLLLETPAAHRWVNVEPMLEAVKIDAGLRTYRRRPERIAPPLLDWIVCGGESGPKARPMEIEWMQGLHDQCVAAGVPFYAKQDSGPRPGMQGRIPGDVWAVKQLPEGWPA